MVIKFNGSLFIKIKNAKTYASLEELSFLTKANSEKRAETEKPKKKRKGPKQPNPLSCKKKKVKILSQKIESKKKDNEIGKVEKQRYKTVLFFYLFFLNCSGFIINNLETCIKSQAPIKRENTIKMIMEIVIHKVICRKKMMKNIQQKIIISRIRKRGKEGRNQKKVKNLND